MDNLWMLRVVLPLDGIQYVTFISRHVPRIRTIRSNDEDGNKNVQKKKPTGLISKTTTLQVHHALLYISFLHDYDVKMPNFAFYGVRNKQRRNFVSLSALGYGPRHSTPGGFAYI